MERHSLYRSACAEVLAVQGGHDGAAAAGARTQWNRDEWWRWAAERALQHVRGEAYWTEFGDRTFASVTGENHQGMKLLHRLEALRPRLSDPALADYRGLRAATAEWMSLVNALLDGGAEH